MKKDVGRTIDVLPYVIQLYYNDWESQPEAKLKGKKGKKP